MKFTITNKRNELRSVPVQGNYEMMIQPYGTLVLDYPAGAESFFKGLKNYDYDVKVESSELDKKIDEHNKKMKTIQKKVIKEEIKKQVELKNSIQMPIMIENPFYLDDNDTTVIQSTTLEVVKEMKTSNETEKDIKESATDNHVKDVETTEESINVEEKEIVLDAPTEESKVEDKIEDSKEEPIIEEVKEDKQDAQDAPAVTEPSETKETIIAKCSSLNAEQLREICKELGINTTSNNANTLTNKIRNSEASDEEVISAYHKVVDTNE